jgi:hypothetical protein
MFDHGGFMRGVIVHDDVNVEAIRDTGVDLFEKIQKLGGPMTLVAFADHESGSDVEGREQRRCAVADVRMARVRECEASSAGLVARDQGLVSGSSRRRSTPAPDWAAIDKDRRCRGPCRRTKGHWKA